MNKQYKLKREMEKRRSPEEILRSLGLTRDSVQKAATASQLKAICRKIPRAA